MRKESGDKNEKENTTEGNRHRLRTVCRTGRGRKGFLTMFMIMLGFTFSRQVCGSDNSLRKDLISMDLSSH